MWSGNRSRRLVSAWASTSVFSSSLGPKQNTIFTVVSTHKAPTYPPRTYYNVVGRVGVKIRYVGSSTDEELTTSLRNIPLPYQNLSLEEGKRNRKLNLNFKKT